MKQTRTFLGGLDLDRDPDLVAPNDYIYARNKAGERGTPGDIGLFRNIKGTSTSLAQGSLTDQYDTCIGTVTDYATNDVYLFFYNSNNESNHKIIRFSNGSYSNVIKSSLLGFASTTKILGGFVVGSILYYADGGEVKAVSVSKWSSSVSGISDKDILLIKSPPLLAPEFEKLDGASEDPDVVRLNEYQFSYQFLYETDQYSVLSPYSQLANQGIDGDTYKKIRIHIPIDPSLVDTTDGSYTFENTDSIPLTVKEIHIFYRYGNIGNFNKIKKIKRGSSGNFEYDYFDFYGNVSGTPISERYTVAFDSVPRDVKTIDIARNRIFAGNYIEGYDTPSGIGLTATLTTTEFDTSGNLTKDLTSSYKIQNRKFVYNGTAHTFIAEDSGTPYYAVFKSNKYYEITGIHGGGTYDPGTYDVNSDTLDTSATPSTLVDEPYPAQPWSDGDYFYKDEILYQQQVYIYINAGTAISGYAGKKTFAPNSSYRLGLLFSDGPGRKCGVYSPDSAQIDVPYGHYIFDAKINWALDPSTSAYIPDWAEYYSIVITKNLKKSYFIDYHTSNLLYRTVDQDGNITYSYDYTAGITDNVVDISGLISAGKGYEYEEGDRIILFNIGGGPDSTSTFDVPIRGLDGTKILLDASDWGILSNPTYNNIRFEIYRPRDNSFTSLFYEVGVTGKIINNGNDRQFSTLTGQLSGDTVNVIRTRYKYDDGSFEADPVGEGDLSVVGDELYHGISVDDFNPDALWNTDHGRGFIEDDIGERSKPTFVRFGGTYIQDTKINALNEFDPTAEQQCSIENGDIQRLILTTKTQGDGGVLLSIGVTGLDSVYIGETNMNVADGTSFFITSKEVIGDVRPFRKNRRGTLHPESVKQFNGNVFWYDQINKSFVIYDVNGTSDASDNGVISHFIDQTDAIQSGDRVRVGVDPSEGLLFVTFDRVMAGEGTEKKTISFSLDDKKWKSFYDFAPVQYFEYYGEMYSVVGGAVHSHSVNGSNYTTFYGTLYPYSVTVSFNGEPNIEKEHNVIEMFIDNQMLDWVGGEQVVTDSDFVVTLTNSKGQSTDIQYDEFDIDEGTLYGPILKDSNSTGGLLEGDDIVSTTLRANILFKDPDKHSIFTIALSSKVSRGHLSS